MAIPKRGARTIVVDSVSYIWRVSKAMHHDQNRLHAAIELANDPGTTLVVIAADRPHPKEAGIYIDASDVVPITPRDVSDWIGAALQLGWNPKSNGSPLVLQARERRQIVVLSPAELEGKSIAIDDDRI